MVVLALTATSVTLQITDNGQGFDPRQPERHPAWAGLLNMRERARLSGCCEISSRLGVGATVWVEVRR